MAIKLPTNQNANWATKLLWKKRQANEFTRVDNYKEGYCFNCFSRQAVSATLVDICKKCDHKKGRDACLVNVVEKYYGMCYFCGDYDFKIDQINVRLCQKCYYHVRVKLKAYNKAGGFMHHDPFWKKMKKKNGNDWKHLFFPPMKKLKY